MVPNLQFTKNDNNIFLFDIPVRIPAGERVALRCQSTTASEAVQIGLYGAPAQRFLQEGTVAVYGDNTADSGGTQIDPGGTANTKGSYSQITASTTRHHRGLFICVGSQANAAASTTRNYIDIAIGAASSEKIIIPDIHYRTTTSEDFCPMPFYWPVSIPEGTSISAELRPL